MSKSGSSEGYWLDGRRVVDWADYEALLAERDRLRSMVDALRPRPADRKTPDSPGEYTVYAPSLGVTDAYLDISVPYGRKRPVRHWIRDGDGYYHPLPEEPTHYYPAPEPPGAWWELGGAEGE